MSRFCLGIHQFLQEQDLQSIQLQEQYAELDEKYKQMEEDYHQQQEVGTTS